LVKRTETSIFAEDYPVLVKTWSNILRSSIMFYHMQPTNSLKPPLIGPSLMAGWHSS